MTTVTVEIESRQVIGYLQSAPHRIDRALRAAMDDSTSLLKRDLNTYPANRSRKLNPGQFVSDRQRKFVMAAIREGRIKIPYKRTRTLSRAWHVPPYRSVAGMLHGEVVSSGNMAPYNRRVQDRELQARLHQGNWATVQTVGERRASTIQRYFDRRLREEFGR
jgi:hypothetical protein